MLRIIFLCLSCLLLNLPISSAKDPFEGQEERAKPFMGKTFWVCQGWNDFKQTPDIYQSDYITISQPAISFTIQELIPSPTSEYKGKILKFRYDNGDIGYISLVSFERFLPIQPGKADQNCNVAMKYDNIFETNPAQNEEDCQKEIAEREAKEREEKSKKKAKLQKLLESKIGVKLPPAYKGHDFKKIFSRLSAVSKNEFEKTVDYEKRLKAINLEDVYALRIFDKDLGLNVAVVYDPDSERFNVKINTSVIFAGQHNFPISSFVALKTTHKFSSYIGTNAFGATKEILKDEGAKEGVRIVNNDLSSRISFSMSTKDAKKYKNNVDILLICKPYIDENNVLSFTGIQSKEPTFDSPIETSYFISGINVELLEIWVYDFKTGKILHKESYYE